MAPTFWSLKVALTLPDLMWMLAATGLGVADGEAVGVPVGAGVEPPVDGAAVAWMNGLRLVNWSSVGSCLAGSTAARPLPVDEATPDVSARPAAAGFSAPRR